MFLWLWLLHWCSANILSSEHLGTVKFPNSQVYVRIDRILYSTRIQNEVVPARTLVFSPVSFVSKTESPSFLVFYAHPTVGIDCQCSVANNGTNMDKINGVPSLIDFISLGFTVIEPDYYGFVCPQVHPYLIGEPVAISILDAVRAIRTWKTPNPYSHRFCGFGWSQGGHAVLWTQTYVHTYAPELELLTVGAIAPPTNLSGLIDRNLKSLPGKFLALLGLYSWPTYYPSVLAMDQIVAAKKIPTANQLAQVCLLKYKPERNPQLIGLLTLGKNWLRQNPKNDWRWNYFMAFNSPPALVSNGTKLLVFQGKEDELIAWNVTQEWVQSIQEGTVEFFLYEHYNHHTVLQVALPIIIGEIVTAFSSS